MANPGLNRTTLQKIQAKTGFIVTIAVFASLVVLGSFHAAKADDFQTTLKAAESGDAKAQNNESMREFM